VFRRVLVANRGEIACRVIATCRRLGIHTIAVFSEADRHARHVRLADEAHPVGPAPAAQSYLDPARVLAVARATRADAVHPGYGFLSENTAFAEACAGAGIVFIGPSPEAIRRMGLKHEAKSLVAAAGVPVVPGYHGDDTDPRSLAREAGRIGFPLLVKAVAGGGGKGMRVVRAADELAAAVEAAGREAASSFGDARVLLERFIERPRHIEFLEVNTRLQVEHPVTEAVTGLDLVAWQLAVAAREPLPRAQAQILQGGPAIEARVYSEDPRRGFLPAIGRVERFAFPAEETGWRVDRGIDDGDTIEVHYDPMVAKLIAHGRDRADAIERLAAGLARTAVFGPATNLALLRRLAAHPAFVAGEMDTGFVDRHLDEILEPGPGPAPPALLAIADEALAAARDPGSASPWGSGDAWQTGGLGSTTLGIETPVFQRLRVRRNGPGLVVEAGGHSLQGTVESGEHDLRLVEDPEGASEVVMVAHGSRMVVTAAGATHEVRLTHPWPYAASVPDEDTHPASPLPGRVVALFVTEGQAVAAGATLAIIEGMKMQHTVRAGRSGRIRRVCVAEGELIEAEAVLCEIDPC